jgi:hypothetical protein
VTDPGRWQRLNDQLSSTVGDIDDHDEADQQPVWRIDRSMPAYERVNDRGHVVYANVQVPPAVNYSNLLEFTRHSFPGRRPGRFDRYTAAADNLHEMTISDPAGWTAVFEIQTGAVCTSAARTRSTTPDTCCLAACSWRSQTCTRSPTGDPTEPPVAVWPSSSSTSTRNRARD